MAIYVYIYINILMIILLGKFAESLKKIFVRPLLKKVCPSLSCPDLMIIVDRDYYVTEF